MLDVHDGHAKTVRVLGRAVVGMEIGDDLRRFRAVQIAERDDDALEGVAGLRRLEVPNMLADKHTATDAEPDRILQMCADGQRRLDCLRQHHGQRCIPPRPPQHHLPIEHDLDDRIIDGSDDRAIMDEKQIGQAVQPLERLVFVDADAAHRSRFRWSLRPPGRDRALVNDGGARTAA